MESQRFAMSEKKTLTEKRFFEWHEDDVSVTLRNRGGSYGGGSEVLVICSTRTRSEQSVQEIIRESEVNMSERTS